jgi:hypothetical protein
LTKIASFESERHRQAVKNKCQEREMIMPVTSLFYGQPYYTARVKKVKFYPGGRSARAALFRRLAKIT